MNRHEYNWHAACCRGRARTATSEEDAELWNHIADDWEIIGTITSELRAKLLLLSRTSQSQTGNSSGGIPIAVSAKTSDVEKSLDNSPFLLARCSRDLRYQYVSKACAHMLGRTQEEIIGRRIIDIIGRRAFETIRPFIDDVLTGRRVEYERVVDYLIAGPRHVHVTKVPEFDEKKRVIGWTASVVDITERVEAEAKRCESESRFRIMANSAPVMLWMSGRDGLCHFFNAGWLGFTGRTMDQEIGLGWAQGVHPDDLQHCLETYRLSFDARQTFEMEYRLRRYDGEYRWVVDKGAPYFGSGGEFVGYVGSAIDIAERKRAEEERHEFARLQRLTSLGEWAAGIAHELRQPLAAIALNAGAAALRLRESTDPELQETISDIAEASRRAGEIIARMRQFTGKQKTRQQPLDCNSTISAALQLISHDAIVRRVRIHKDFAPGLPSVSGDPIQLQQVVINLVVNGMDAMADTPEIERCLTIQTRKDANGFVEVAVVDRGSGIAPGALPQLFNSFFTTKTEGTGLGLSISRSIIHSHRGHIIAENNPVRGATFRFLLPPLQDRHPIEPGNTASGPACRACEDDEMLSRVTVL